MSVQVNQLSKVYGEQRAVDRISFQAKPGEVLGFLGPNGAGKTTTMKMVTGYIPPTEGAVQVCDINVEESPIAAQQHIGYLPEHNPLYRDMYVKEYLSFVGRLHKIPKLQKRIADLIELTGLTIEQHKRIEALSKGYRQRVGLAQAMLHDPAVLILDEPTSGLDPNQLAEIRGLIKRLGEEKTVILSTHIMQEVEALCDRVVIINEGKIVANDPVERLQSRIKGESLVTVAFSKDVKEKDLTALTHVSRVEKMGKKRWRLFASADQDIRPAIFHFAVEHENVLLELHRDERSVEDVFRHLTQKADG